MARQDSQFFEVIAAIEKAGWVTDKTKKNHWKLTPPGGGQSIFTSGTPGDFRAYQNFLTKLRRAGFSYRKNDTK